MSIFKRAYTALVKHRTRKAIAALTDRQLEDIGVLRADIPAYVDRLIRS